MIDANEQLQLLREAQRHPAKLALAIVDLMNPELPEASRAELKTALAAAAIPHWFDVTILDVLLDPPRSNREPMLGKLVELSVVEPFPARGFSAADVHESARFALRKHLAKDDSDRFRLLSARMAAYFEKDQSVTGRIEWVYHLLSADPERGVKELEELSRNWFRIAHPDVRYALASALKELEKTGLLHGSGKIHAHIVSSWVRFLRGQFANLRESAEEILEEARSIGDENAMLDGYAMASVAYQGESALEQALKAAKRALEIAQRLSGQSPDNLGAVQDLAATMNQYGDVLEAMGKRGEALDVFIEAHRIIEDLVRRDPERISALRDLAVGCNRVGGVLESTPGRRAEAETVFRTALKINRSLNEKDPENSDWQRELAIAHNRLGAVFQAESRFSDALAEYEEACQILTRLTELDQLNLGWRRDLALTQARRGTVFQAEAKPEEAKKALEAAIEILQNIDAIDRLDPQWQLTTALVRREFGLVLTTLQSFAEARTQFEAALKIHQRLLELNPGNADWKRELENTVSAMNVVTRNSSSPSSAG